MNGVGVGAATSPLTLTLSPEDGGEGTRWKFVMIWGFRNSLPNQKKSKIRPLVPSPPGRGLSASGGERVRVRGLPANLAKHFFTPSSTYMVHLHLGLRIEQGEALF
jgi:hypothetical protein